MNRRTFTCSVLAAAMASALSSQRVRATDYSAAEGGGVMLRVYSTTDTRLFEPVIRDFQSTVRGISIRYEELDAGDLYERFLADAVAGRPGADLLLSSAMDLQVKLV